MCIFLKLKIYAQYRYFVLNCSWLDNTTAQATEAHGADVFSSSLVGINIHCGPRQTEDKIQPWAGIELGTCAKHEPFNTGLKPLSHSVSQSEDVLLSNTWSKSEVLANLRVTPCWGTIPRKTFRCKQRKSMLMSLYLCCRQPDLADDHCCTRKEYYSIHSVELACDKNGACSLTSKKY